MRRVDAPKVNSLTPRRSHDDHENGRERGNVVLIREKSAEAIVLDLSRKG
jgi:hypothetical protein